MQSTVLSKIKEPKFKGAKSTESVLIIDDAKKAKVMHKKAARCGKAHLYKVKKKV